MLFRSLLDYYYDLVHHGVEIKGMMVQLLINKDDYDDMTSEIITKRENKMSYVNQGGIFIIKLGQMTFRLVRNDYTVHEKSLSGEYEIHC